jgi:hypothetical protein
LRGEHGVLDGCFAGIKNTPPELKFSVEISIFHKDGQLAVRRLLSIWPGVDSDEDLTLG